MRLVAVLAVLLVGCATAGPYAQPMSGPEGLLVGSMGADLGTTLIGLSECENLREGNPLGLVGAMAVSAWLTHRLIRWGRRTPSGRVNGPGVQRLVAGVRFALAGWNAHNLAQECR